MGQKMDFSKLLILISITLFKPSICQFGFSQEQIELYELFYELKPTSFYQILGVESDATKRQVKSAYRKKAISWHPDKVDKSSITTEEIFPKGLSVEDFIEHRFRQVTKISEILQNEELRNDYDDVLKNGLPPGMSFILGNKYGRYILKLNVYQVMIFVSIVLTLVHYLMLWGRHLERTWAINSAKSNITTKNKQKLKERLAKFDNLVLEKPTWKNSLPVVIVQGLIWLVKDYPKILREKAEREKQRVLLEKERIEAEKKAAEEAEEEKLKREEQKKINKEKHKIWLEEKRKEAAERYEEALKEQEERMAEMDSEYSVVENLTDFRIIS